MPRDNLFQNSVEDAKDVLDLKRMVRSRSTRTILNRWLNSTFFFQVFVKQLQMSFLDMNHVVCQWTLWKFRSESILLFSSSQVRGRRGHHALLSFSSSLVERSRYLCVRFSYHSAMSETISSLLSRSNQTCRKKRQVFFSLFFERNNDAFFSFFFVFMQKKSDRDYIR